MVFRKYGFIKNGNEFSIMARVQILGQKCPFNDKMLIRGVFTQKTKLWAALESLRDDLDKFILTDDMGEKPAPLTYARLCTKLTKAGRASLAMDGVREFQISDALTNELRDWDVTEEGLRCNPIK